MGIEEFVDRKRLVDQSETPELEGAEWIERESASHLQRTFESPLDYQRTNKIWKYVAAGVGTLALVALAYMGSTMISVEPSKPAEVRQREHSKPKQIKKSVDDLFSELNKDNIDEFLKNEKNVIIVYAQNSMSCRRYELIIKENVQKYTKEGIHVGRIDYHKNKDLIKRLVKTGILNKKIENVPTTLIVPGGKEVARSKNSNPTELYKLVNTYFLKREERIPEQKKVSEPAILEVF